MELKLELRELTIVVVAKSHNPTILNPDFLRNNKIVPKDWKIAKNPICVEPYAEVVYESGVSIEAQFNSLVFKESLENKSLENLMAPVIAESYVETLPHVDYKALGINPRGHVVFEDEDTRGKFLSDGYLKKDPWEGVNDHRLNIGIKITHRLKDARCTLFLDEAEHEVSDTESIPVVVFYANFHREIEGESVEERTKKLRELILDWQKDLEIYMRVAANQLH